MFMPLRTLVLAGVSVLSCRSGDEHMTDASTIPANPLCERVVKNVKISLSLEGWSPRRRLRVVLSNRTTLPLWVPRDGEPAYRAVESDRTVVISYGFFEEVYGSHREHYMIPSMEVVPANQQHEWEITDPELMERVLGPGYRTTVQLRLALRAFEAVPLRGGQDLAGYLKESCVVRSSPFQAQAR